MHNFTTEDLIQFVYNESSAQKATAIKIAIETDCAFREKYDEVMSTYQILQKLNFSPLKKSIDKIVAHAEKSAQRLTSEV